MANRLKDQLNSKYFEAANALTSKKARRRIVAYVESYDDVYPMGADEREEYNNL